MTLTAQTPAFAGQAIMEENGTMELYKNHPSEATPNPLIVEKQLGWAIQTLRNSGLRPNERACILLGAGQILISFLGRESVRTVK